MSLRQKLKNLWINQRSLLTLCSLILILSYTMDILKARSNYDEIGVYVEGLAKVERDDKWGFIDERGSEVIPLIYESASDFSEDLALVELDNNYGFINKSGQIVIPIKSPFIVKLYCGEAFGKIVYLIVHQGSHFFACFIDQAPFEVKPDSRETF